MSWTTEPLAGAPLDIIDGDRGKNYPNQSQLLEEGFCLFLNAGNVTKDGFVFDTCQFVTEDKDNALRKGKAQREDVILTTRGTLGNVAYYSENVPYDHVRINSGMVVVRSDARILLPRYVYFYLKSSAFQSQVRSLQSGAAQPQLPIRDIKKIKISYPEVNMQEDIVDVIAAYDDLIENNLRRIALLEEAARLLYREWFVHFRFPGAEHVKIVNGVPEGWVKTNVGSISDFLSRGITPKYDEDGESIVINQKCIRGSKLNLELSRKQTKKIPEAKYVQRGDVLINSTGAGTLGRVAQCQIEQNNLTVDSHVTIARSAEGVPHLWFGLLFFSMEDHIATMGRGATNQTELSRNDLAELKVIMPNHSILAEFEQIAAPIILQISALSEQSLQLAKARDLLLPRLMDGRLEI